MKFIDEVQIYAKAGDGGKGCVSFRREPYVPRGGPDGGDGGNGGDVIVRATRQMTTLLDYKYRKNYDAKRGGHGEGKNKNGKHGDNIILKIPVGTVILDAATDCILCDLTKDKEEFILAKGGQGGKGNSFFKNSINQAPDFSEPPTLGEEKNVKLELKLLADVGIVGFPNSGKSTFISVVSNARPKIAGYPFTTLVPNLGVVRAKTSKDFVIADVPGLIENAHKGAGLGIRFLKHLERTRILLIFLDISTFLLDEKHNLVQDYYTLLNELAKHSLNLRKKEKIIVFTKCDLIKGDNIYKKAKQYFDKQKLTPHSISSHTHKGIKELIEKIGEKLVLFKKK